jgi:hypothetical protein
MSKRKPDSRIPEELANSGWRIATTSHDLFYLHKNGIKTAHCLKLETAIEAAWRIATGRMPGIQVRRRTTPSTRAAGGLKR